MRAHLTVLASVAIVVVGACGVSSGAPPHPPAPASHLGGWLDPGGRFDSGGRFDADGRLIGPGAQHSLGSRVERRRHRRDRGAQQCRLHARPGIRARRTGHLPHRQRRRRCGLGDRAGPDGHILGEKENLAAGMTGSFTLDLAAGRYSLVCPGATVDSTDFEVVADGTAPSAGAHAPLLDTATAGYAASDRAWGTRSSGRAGRERPATLQSVAKPWAGSGGQRSGRSSR